MLANIKTAQLPIKRILSSATALIILLLLFTIQEPSLEEQILLFIIAIVFGSYYFSIEALEAIFKKHKINTDVLMLLAYLAAGFLGQFIDATLLIFLYSITETLESITIKRTRSMIYSLVKSIPQTCTLLTQEGEKQVNIDSLVPNDIILIRAGDMIPIDGIIIKGSAYINESSLTGEFLPAFKTIHNTVYAGTLVTDSILTIKVLKKVSESAVAKLIKTVEEAQKHKHPLDLLVNRFTKIYNPILISISALIILFGIFSGDIQTYGIMGASFLIAGAPCALAIGTPVTVIAAIGSAGKNGILVKGGASLERLAEINAFAFDKTGTLTFGQPELSDIKVFEKSKNDILSISAGLEYSSNHPYAKIILETALQEKVNAQDMDKVTVIPGYGIEGLYNNKRYYIGSIYQDYRLKSNEITLQAESLKEQGYSLSYVFEETSLIGILLFKDTIRKETSETIEKLHQKNLQTYILTGDNEQNALRVGKELHIPKELIFASQKPDTKLNKILELKKEKTLAMIGDGINDAPALASADLGIAMGTIGTDIAIDTADMLIMSDSLSVLDKGLAIASKMKSVLRQNIIISSLIIIGVLSGIMLGYIDLSLAILAHEGSEVLIVGNSLRLLSKV